VAPSRPPRNNNNRVGFDGLPPSVITNDRVPCVSAPRRIHLLDQERADMQFVRVLHIWWKYVLPAPVIVKQVCLDAIVSARCDTVLIR